MPSAENDPNSPLVTGTCHCGSLRLTFPKPTAPLNSCQCSLCIRVGGLWTYFKKDQVTISVKEGSTRSREGELVAADGDFSSADHPVPVTAYGLGPGIDNYFWGDKDLYTCRCASCGNVTHWIPSPSWNGDRVGVNARILGADLLEEMEVVKSPGPD